MKTYIFLLLAVISISDSLYSQKFKKPIDYRFKFGETGYISFFSKNITYPVLAIKNGTIANSITRISLNPKGEINGVNIINPIDSTIDNEVLRVIDLSKKLWKACDTINQDQVFYIQIAFSLLNFQPNICVPKSKEIMKLFPEPILITPPKPLLSSLSQEVDSCKISYIRSEELSEKANSYLDAGKFAEALPFINELIKRDPFNRDLYKVRIMINIRLNRSELVDQDDNKIFNFAEGFSLDEINKNDDL
jgi:hypothetical protein